MTDNRLPSSHALLDAERELLALVDQLAGLSQDAAAALAIVAAEMDEPVSAGVVARTSDHLLRLDGVVLGHVRTAIRNSIGARILTAQAIEDLGLTTIVNARAIQLVAQTQVL